MNEVIHVVAWRDPKPRYKFDASPDGYKHTDDYGLLLKNKTRCEYCGRSCVRYDTLDHLPAHEKCTWVAAREAKNRLPDNVYVEAIDETNAV